MSLSKIYHYHVLFTILLFLLLCQVQNKVGDKVSYCITTKEKGAECQSLQVLNKTNETFERLSDLLQEGRLMYMKVTIYLTSEDHSLDQDLTFDGKVHEARIHGISTTKLSTIRCSDAGGVQFTHAEITISNIIFSKCSKVRLINWNGIKRENISVALHLNQTSYTLENVTISNTNGLGLYAYKCSKQIIRNCIFDNNKLGNIRMLLWHLHENVTSKIISIHIDNATICHASGVKESGGLNIAIYPKYNCSVTINNSIFQSNKWRHLYVEVREENEQPNSISIINSTFSDLAHDPDNENGSSGAIELIKVSQVLINNCSIHNNMGSGMTI